jgi:hypothetical protein
VAKPEFLTITFEEVGFSGDGIDDRDVKAAALNFSAKTLGEADLRELGCRVRAHEGHSTLADNRRDDDDVAACLRPKHRESRAGGVVSAEVVHVHDGMHLVGCDPVDLTIQAVARIAHHHVEPPELPEGCIDERLHVGWPCDVGGDGQGTPAGWRISSATRSSLSVRRAQMATDAPSRASRRAVARPIPDEAPVIAATMAMMS